MGRGREGRRGRGDKDRGRGINSDNCCYYGDKVSVFFKVRHIYRWSEVQEWYVWRSVGLCGVCVCETGGKDGGGGVIEGVMMEWEWR